MRASSILVPALCASVFAAPVYPDLNVKAAMPDDAISDISQYFNMLAQKTQEGRQMSQAPACDLSAAKLPVASPEALPDVTPGLILKHVAVGRGTQNYTCDTSNTTAAPTAAGAVATLFNASCIAATYPDLLNMLPRVSMAFNLTASPSYPKNLVPTSTNSKLAPGNYVISGHHYFTDNTTPFFTLDTDNLKLGVIPCSKKAAVAAPADAPAGQQGEKAVPWLKLSAKLGATGRLQEVYRVETAGGSAPSTCSGMPASFQVEYSAQYWFFESES
ncbi:putative malate dehydrogenase [Diaporthe ampelina]|uniref:Putative malate dehydrogenase n=1 Tax=Diaporthe ampelina TaxID=1214573 RepID=A0A0G2FJZ8_9PEZI|nr:putative malate dehydrogenase [Diaporthe ampelina]